MQSGCLPLSRGSQVICSRYKQTPVISGSVGGDGVVDAFYIDGGIGDTSSILTVSHHPLHSSVDLQSMNINTRKMMYAHWIHK